MAVALKMPMRDASIALARDARLAGIIMAAIVLLAILARIMWVVIVPPGGDSLLYWDWVGILGQRRGYPNAPQWWTGSYPRMLWLFSFGRVLDLRGAAITEAIVQAALIIPMVQLLRLLRFPTYAVLAGALGLAVAPYTSFAASRPLPDPLATLLWWSGLVALLTIAEPRVVDRRWWITMVAACAALGLSAHLRLGMIPPVGVSCLCVLVLVWRTDRGAARASIMAVTMLVATTPALLTMIPTRRALADFVQNQAAVRVWSSTYYLGYDRHNDVDHSLPWEGHDPRPYMPPGWKNRDDAAEADALIAAAMAGAPRATVEPKLVALGTKWKSEHPFAYNVELPLVRIAAAWIPLTPELWYRATPYRVAQYGERVVTLIGFIVLGTWACGWTSHPARPIAIVVWVSAFALPTLTVLSTHLSGMEFSDYRVHHAGWVPPLAVGSAWIATVMHGRITNARPASR